MRHHTIRASALGALAGILAWTGLLFGDTLQLNDGSVIKGEIEGIANGKVSIKTSFAGTLQIAQSSVTAMSTDKELHFAFESGDVLVGQVATEGGKTEITTVNGAVDVSKNTLQAAWKPGAKSPLEPAQPKERKWKYELAANVSGRTGNTESNSLGGSFKATLASDNDKLVISAKGTRTEENGTKTADELSGSIDYESLFSKRQSWYTRMKLETNDIKLLDLRTTAAAGYGYYFLKEADHELRGRAGLMYVHESYAEAANIEDSSSPGLDLGLYHMWKIKGFGELVNEVTYTPTFEDFNDYQIDHTSSLDMPLGNSGAWTLRLGISNDYTSLPAKDTERLDTTYFTKLVLSF